MSWDFTVNGSNSAEVLNRLTLELAKPATAAHKEDIGIAAGVLAGALFPSRVRSIRAWGHVNPDGSGSVNLSINS